METPRARLLRELQELEADLRRAWAREAPPIPRQLESYRRAWLLTVEREPRAATRVDLLRACCSAEPILVGDFHPLRRARHALGEFLHTLPGARPGLVLELLEEPRVLTAQEVLEGPERALVDGRSLQGVFRDVLEALARRGGLVGGAWVDGDVETRDHAAAQRWATLRVAHPAVRWILFFGDWHLAEPHLPAALRRHGAQPLVLHHSPEPLWESSGCGREELLQLGDGHWAWMQVPPLSHWALLAQEQGGDPEAEAEAAEGLCEALAEELAAVLGLPVPTGRATFWPAGEWASFHASLPPLERAAWPAEHRPVSAVTHPELPWIWTERLQGLDPLIDAAAHLLASDPATLGGHGARRRLAQRTFRAALVALLDPYHRPPGLAEHARQLFDGAVEGLDETRLRLAAAAWSAGSPSCLEPRPQILALEHLGARCGARLAAEPWLEPSVLRALVLRGGERAIRELLIATIRAA